MAVDHNNIEVNKLWDDQVGLLFIIAVLGKQLCHTVYGSTWKEHSNCLRPFDFLSGSITCVNWNLCSSLDRSEKPAPTPSKAGISIANTASEGLKWDDEKKLWSTWVGEKNLQWSFKYTRRMPRVKIRSSQHISFVYFPQIWSSSYQKRELWTRGQASSAGEFSCSGTSAKCSWRCEQLFHWDSVFFKTITYCSLSK